MTQLPDRLIISGSLAIPLKDLEFRFSRSGGKGGQNVNKVETRVEVRYDLAGSKIFLPDQRARALKRLESRLIGGVVSVISDDARTQMANRVIALERLRILLRDAIRQEKKRRPTRPTAGSRERRLSSKRVTSERKRQRSLRDL